ncbi:TorF family putative porin [Nitrincola sp. MINF-07-Sa-05]|uniref:TorF family putative porin n=1 Tax=Nitrincola salilacus TaxID=3400273 RepID=UPI0039181924
MRSKMIPLAFIAAVPMFGAASAVAEDGPFSANISLVSDYVSRGYSLSNGRPAIQGGLDYAHDSGLYVGTWASSVSERSLVEGVDGVEIDVYVGYAGEAGALGYDVSLARYTFPGSHDSKDTDSTEFVGVLSWEFLSFAYKRDFDFKVHYYNVAASYEVMDGLSLDASFGYSKPDNDSSFRDWSVGASKHLAGLDFGLHYVNSSVKDTPNFDDTLVFSISKYF